MAGLLLQLEGHVLGHMTEPGALPESLDEATLHTPGAAVVVDARKPFEQGVGEARDGVTRILLKDAEGDHEMHSRVVGPDVATAIDP